MELIVVRHGQSEANKAGVIGTDSNLTSEGKQQALDLAKSLSGDDIDAIYCSPLKRTSQTALPLAEELKKEINVDHRIREIEWGEFDGKPESYMEDLLGKNPREELDSFEYDLTKFQGEKASLVEDRVQEFIDELKTKEYKKVVIVCHGGIVRMFNYVITGKTITYQPNGQKLHFKI